MASDALQITSVRIQNFRSIVDERFESKRLNIFVGLNDVGKSNVLRAIDLFFNDEHAASPFLFSRDFCNHAKTPLKKPKEIKIQLTLQLLSTYGSKKVVWKKTWRKDGQENDELRYEDGEELTPKSKIPSLLNCMRFEYVPAVKSQDYFAKLLGNLHGVLITTVEQKIREASAAFTSTINEQTQRALLEIEKRLGIKSAIELPSDLKELFSRLEFRSGAQMQMPLSQRGDGVKARHIPILLRYIAQQADSVRVKGSPRTTTIWGFEEPENNLEMSKAVELARELLEYSDEIQVFATTHSPAFYSMAIENKESTALFLLKASGSEHNDTKITPVGADDVYELDEHVGLLPSIVPSFCRILAERDEVLKRLEGARKINTPIIFVEGETDERVLKRALEIFAPSLLNKVVIKDCKGAAGVKDSLLAWVLSQNKEKAIGIFDRDPKGDEEKKALNEIPRIENQKKEGRIKIISLAVPSELYSIFKSGLKLPITLEELFPVSIWKISLKKGWLESRKNILEFNSFDITEISFQQHLSEKLVPDDLQLVLLNRVSTEHKKSLSKYVCELPPDQISAAFCGFEKMVHEIAAFFGVQ